MFSLLSCCRRLRVLAVLGLDVIELKSIDYIFIIYIIDKYIIKH